MTRADSRLWLLIPLLGAVLFLIADRGAYKGYFEDDELDNLALTRDIPTSEFLLNLVVPRYFTNNFRPAGHLFFRWMGESAGLRFPPYVAAIQAIHLINVTLVWFVMRSLAFSRAVAALGTLFFLFHMAVFDVYWKPMYVFDLLCCCLCLLSLWLYITEHWIASLVAFLVAVHAKEVAIMLPAVFAAYEFLLGQRRWKRLVPFLLVFAIISAQAFTANKHRRENDYILHFDPADVWHCMAFYSSYIFLAPYAGFAVLLGFALYRDRRMQFGLATFGALLVPMLLLPGRLYSAYLYVPLVGLAMAFGALSTHVNALAIALFFAAWLPWNYVNLRWLRNTALSVVIDRQAFMRDVQALGRDHPEILNYVYVAGPYRGYGARAALALVHPGQEIRFAAIQDTEWPEVLRANPLAVLDWDSFHHRLLTAIREPNAPDASYVRMAPGMPLWQLTAGWHPLEGRFRWTDPEARAQLYRPAGAKQFEMVIVISDEYIRKLNRSNLAVSLNGNPIGDRDFTRPGLYTVRWDLAPAPAGPVELIIRTTPPYVGKTRTLGSAVVAFGFVSAETAAP